MRCGARVGRLFHGRAMLPALPRAMPSMVMPSAAVTTLTPRTLALRRGVAIDAAVARSVTAPFSLERINLREPRHDEVLVRIVSTGVCHTDVAVKDRNLCSFPIVLGHEGTGVVERTGAGVSSSQLNKGDHVLIGFASCGACPHCAIGKPAYCYDHGSLNFAGRHPDGSTAHTSASGETIYGHFFQQSSFASHVVANPRNIVKVDKSLDLASLAPLGCGVGTGAGAVMNTLQVPAGSSIAIFGCGAVGLSSIMAAKLSACSYVIAIDRVAARLALAKQLGATHTIQLTGTETPADVTKLVSAVCGGVQYALDTSGNKNALRSAIDALRPLGVCGLIGGTAPGTEVGVDMLGFLNGKQLRGIIQGDSVPSVFIPKLLDLHKQGRFPFDRLITYYDGLGSLNTALADTQAGRAVKAVLRLSKP